MFKDAINQLRIAIILLISLTVLTGVIYPAIVTALAQLLFPWQANGSLIENHGKAIGSKLIGQAFTAPKYFWGRPSATEPFPYNAESSAGSNMALTNVNFLATVKARVAQLRQEDPEPARLIPVDLITASGSGLDPEISPLAAFYQALRVAKARNIAVGDVQQLIHSLIQDRTLGILAEPRVNVLQLNLALDELTVKLNK